MYSAFYFFGWLADLFLSVMLWFILDTKKNPNIIMDGNKVYIVTNVLKDTNSAINIDCEEEE